MSASIRLTSLTNTTGAALLAGGAPVRHGSDFATEILAVTLVAADIGTGAGTTRHASGKLLGEFTGGVIKNIVAVTIVRPTAGASPFIIWKGTDAVTAAYSLPIVQVGSVCSLRIVDLASGAAGYLAAGDIVTVTVAIGNVNG